MWITILIQPQVLQDLLDDIRVFGFEFSCSSMGYEIFFGKEKLRDAIEPAQQ